MAYLLHKYTNWILCGILMFLACVLILSCSTKTFVEDINTNQLAKLTFSSKIENNSDLWPDEQLPQIFAHYWWLRFQGKTKKMFSLEAPYFQEMVNLEKYHNYVKGAANNELIDVQVIDIKGKSEYLYEVPCRLKFKTPNGIVEENDKLDRWVKVDGKWYHVLRNKLIFPRIS